MVVPVCTARARKVLWPCQVLAGARCAEAFILCALQCSTGILYWSGREVAQYKPQHNISYAALNALRHGRRQHEPPLEQSVTGPAHSTGRLLLIASATLEGNQGGG